MVWNDYNHWGWFSGLLAYTVGEELVEVTSCYDEEGNLVAIRVFVESNESEEDISTTVDK